jgi:hypothetical protein
MKYHLTVFVICVGSLTTDLIAQGALENRLGNTNTDSYVDDCCSTASEDDGLLKINTEVPPSIRFTPTSFLLNAAQDVDGS